MKKKYLKLLVIIMAAGLIFPACATHYTAPEREPKTGPPKHLPQIGGKIARRSAPSSPSPIVARLTDRAKGQMKAGNLDHAFATTERAIRIDSSDPHLWNLLAQIQLKRGNVHQAEQLARKSNLLAKDDKSLQAENWRIIAKALRQKGSVQEAEKAERRAKELD
ncbi:tetratricopeptide repeat protein [Desulfonema magnum]|uniref:Tetratricopeptide repeat-containing protein n=1 Tax=Desulfonema magnum TaxID=45655 RepID=A0A975BTQ4_9BACT|nr:tetratricopeptide repeat protein [Desulfonema magnum]QTA91448.1 Tetratricopeptide repeat-containing protein [Desulfonema magnum]